jgi:hypothetical protein
MEGAKREDVRILMHLKHGKEVRSIMERDKRNPSLKVKSQKPEYPVFFRVDRIRLRFEI